jgi:hypothetical protein
MPTIVLDHPFQRGDSTVAEITLLEPSGTGWLKGVKLFDLVQLDADALRTVLPRLTSPSLTEADIRANLHPADLFQLGAKIADFLLPKSARAESPPA